MPCGRIVTVGPAANDCLAATKAGSMALAGASVTTPLIVPLALVARLIGELVVDSAVVLVVFVAVVVGLMMRVVDVRKELVK